MSFAKYSTEEQWRLPYRHGIAQGASETVVVDYWVANAGGRTEDEWGQASANMFAAAVSGVTGHQVEEIVAKTRLVP